MCLSKSKSWYSNNCLHFIKLAVPLVEPSTNDPKFMGLNALELKGTPNLDLVENPNFLYEYLTISIA